jgi:hypothetical protein
LYHIMSIFNLPFSSHRFVSCQSCCPVLSRLCSFTFRSACCLLCYALLFI